MTFCLNLAQHTVGGKSQILQYKRQISQGQGRVKVSSCNCMTSFKNHGTFTQGVIPLVASSKLKGMARIQLNL